MKKALVALLAAALMCFGVFALVGCGGGGEEAQPADETQAAAPADNVLNVGFDAEYPPYGYLADAGAEGYVADDGQTYTGFDLDLAQEVCKRNGWELKVTPIDWDSKDALLGSGEISCIWNGFTYEGREDQYAFTEPYMVNAQVVVVKADSGIASLADLADKHVITQAGSAALTLLADDGDKADLAKTFAGGAVETIADYNAAFMQLESGAVDAVACDLSVAIHQMNANKDAYKQLDEQLSGEHYAVGFALGQEGLAQVVNDTLKAMDSEGFVETLCDKYEDIDYANWCLGQVPLAAETAE